MLNAVAFCHFISFVLYAHLFRNEFIVLAALQFPLIASQLIHLFRFNENCSLSFRILFYFVSHYFSFGVCCVHVHFSSAFDHIHCIEYNRSHHHRHTKKWKDVSSCDRFVVVSFPINQNPIVVLCCMHVPIYRFSIYIAMLNFIAISRVQFYPFIIFS